MRCNKCGIDPSKNTGGFCTCEVFRRDTYVLASTETHAKLYEQLNKIAPDKLQDIIQRLKIEGVYL